MTDTNRERFPLGVWCPKCYSWPYMRCTTWFWRRFRRPHFARIRAALDNS